MIELQNTTLKTLRRVCEYIFFLKKQKYGLIKNTTITWYAKLCFKRYSSMH